LTDLSIYHEKILKLASLNKNSIELIKFDSSYELRNPMCGDEVNVKILLENKMIKEISAKVRGCALCEASAGLVVKTLTKKNTPIINFMNDFKKWLEYEDYNNLNNCPSEIEIFYPIKSIKNRHTCITMPFQAAINTLEKLNSLKL
tara:strand:- start:1788 stop:2225 length:438 start_codon:yes stop_codon:yes gene_type:complete